METQLSLLPTEVDFESIWDNELKPMLMKLSHSPKESIRGLQTYRLEMFLRHT